MPDDSDLEIVGDTPAVADGRSSVLTLEMPLLPPPKETAFNLEQERQELLAFIHQADASLSVLMTASNLLTQSRALAVARHKALTDYSRAALPDDDDEPIAF